LASQPNASVIVANSSTTRSGVQNQCRPSTAWRPSGPPMILAARAGTGSVQLGTTLSSIA